MNIFYTNDCYKKCAEDMPDKLLVKMVLETAQILSITHRVLDGDEYADKVGMCKLTHKNHPCSIWAREISGNYTWLFLHFIALCNEYTYRYGKVHKKDSELREPLRGLPLNIKYGVKTRPAQAMPNKYKTDDATVAYRNYMIHEKHYAKWNKNRPRPKWWSLNLKAA